MILLFISYTCHPSKINKDIPRGRGSRSKVKVTIVQLVIYRTKVDEKFFIIEPKNECSKKRGHVMKNTKSFKL